MARGNRVAVLAIAVGLIAGVALVLTVAWMRSPTPTPTTAAPNTPPPSMVWPDETNTGVARCGALTQLDNAEEINLDANTVYENVELLNPTVLQIRGPGVTVRCVKFAGGTGYFGIDNTHYSPTGDEKSLVVDRVDIDCMHGGQLTGMLVHSATVQGVNVHSCEDGVKIGGNDVIIAASYCHDLTNIPVAHSDCIQSYGDNRGLRVEGNSLWGRDTSDILMGQEGGDSRDVTIHANRFMSVGSPAPAFLLYVSGTNTVVTDNHFSRRYTHGACTLTTAHPVTWSGNTWEGDGSPIPLDACR